MLKLCLQEGEIWLKGPNVFSGYLNRPDLAKDTFSDCGFFKTGDIGYVDAKGNFFITDRLKELIKYSESWRIKVLPFAVKLNIC
jgi:4-coumarate--CoA ligase